MRPKVFGESKEMVAERTDFDADISFLNLINKFRE
jgi:hypothetical protein